MSFKGRLIVNGLGEVYFDRLEVDDCVDLVDVARALGKPVDKLTQADTDAALAAGMRQSLDEPEVADVVLRTWAAQRVAEQSPHAARVIYDHAAGLCAQVEFRTFLDSGEFWSALDAKVAQIGAVLHLMGEDEYPDRSSRDGGKTWIEGPDHGRMERQVSVSLPLDDDASPQAIAQACERLSSETRDLWEQAGVGIM